MVPARLLPVSNFRRGPDAFLFQQELETFVVQCGHALLASKLFNVLEHNLLACVTILRKVLHILIAKAALACTLYLG